MSASVPEPDYNGFKKFIFKMFVRACPFRSGTYLKVAIYTRTQGKHEGRENQFVTHISQNWRSEQSTLISDNDYRNVIRYGITDWIETLSVNYAGHREMILEKVDKDRELKSDVFRLINSKVEESKFREDYLWERLAQEARDELFEFRKRAIIDKCTFLINMPEGEVLRLLRSIRVEETLKS